MASFVLRVLLVAVLWMFVWRFFQPQTQAGRIARAGLVVLFMLGVLAVTRAVGL